MKQSLSLSSVTTGTSLASSVTHLLTAKRIEIGTLALTLWGFRRVARVVVLLTSSRAARTLIGMVHKLGGLRHFVWLCSDRIAHGFAQNELSSLGPQLNGVIIVNARATAVPDYDEYFMQLKPEKTDDPWFRRFWKEYCGDTCNETVKAAIKPFFGAGRMIDSIQVIADGIARVLEKKSDCVQKSLQSGKSPRLCVDPKLLVTTIINDTWRQGYTGFLRFNEKGDLLGSYVIGQIIYAGKNQNGRQYSTTTLAVYDSVDKNFQLKDFDWERTHNVDKTKKVVSRCSIQCPLGQRRQLSSILCCWSCVDDCHPNERLVKDETLCEACPEFFWPNDTTRRTTCIEIEVTRKMSFGLLVLGTALTCCLVVVSLAVAVFLYKHRRCYIVVITSPAMSTCMLLASMLGCVTMILEHFTHTNAMCRTRYLLISSTLGLLCSTLLVRSIRAFVLHQTQFSRLWIRQQKTLMSGLFSIQFATAVLWNIVYDEWITKMMPDPYEPIVVIICQVPVAAFRTLVAYNLLLVTSSALVCFTVRDVRDHFLEGRFLLMSSCTMLVVWTCAVPAYYLSPVSEVRDFLIDMFMALEVTVVLVFMFVGNKVYPLLTTSEPIRKRYAKIVPDSYVRQPSSPHAMSQPRMVRLYSDDFHFMSYLTVPTRRGTRVSRRWPSPARLAAGTSATSSAAISVVISEDPSDSSAPPDVSEETHRKTSEINVQPPDSTEAKKVSFPDQPEADSVGSALTVPVDDDSAGIAIPPHRTSQQIRELHPTTGADLGTTADTAEIPSSDQAITPESATATLKVPKARRTK
ncbi:hypothetical protein BaRGS_00025890 [Batillaria attramentaria]|uniref:G-protein coupled receptors family 3 profile domain-containing protein n=1 Tax=Batillaria attramentaria TaxID=370345 RepID=A0ABD0K5X8_9CAEN